MEKNIQVGDKVMCAQKKASTKTPWDPSPYVVKEFKGSQVVVEREGRVKKRAKNHVKKLKPRPEYLQTQPEYRREEMYGEEAEVSDCYMARSVQGRGEGIQVQEPEVIQEVQEPEFVEVQEPEEVQEEQEPEEGQEVQDFEEVQEFKEVQEEGDSHQEEEDRESVQLSVKQPSPQQRRKRKASARARAKLHKTYSQLGEEQ